MVNSSPIVPPSIQPAWLEFVTHSGLPILDETSQIAETFAPEMRRYCELMQGPSGTPIGLMIRGENRQFTARVHTLMQAWSMPDEGITHYLSLAEIFEHKRTFLKLEWHHIPEAGQVEHLTAFYFRRRPSVRRVLEHLQLCGVRTDILERTAQLASILGKDSIHFVSAAMRPNHEIHHKLYFSQYITPEQSAVVRHRLLQVLEWFEIDPTTRTHLAQSHQALAPPDQIATIFVSISFTPTRLIPSVKIDYPNVPPQVCVSLLPLDERTSAEAEIQKLCALVGLEKLSYLGVRFHQSGPLSLKYYADFQME